MSRRSSLSALAVLAASGALIAGCSSSSSSASSTPTASATSAAASVSATSASASSTAGSSTKPSAADCTIINKISSGVVTTLEPLASESTSKAAATLKAYLATLSTQQAQLTSPGGKAAVASFIAALEKASNETPAQATPGLTTAITNLASACA